MNEPAKRYRTPESFEKPTLAHPYAAPGVRATGEQGLRSRTGELDTTAADEQATESGGQQRQRARVRRGHRTGISYLSYEQIVGGRVSVVWKQMRKKRAGMEGAFGYLVYHEIGTDRTTRVACERASVPRSDEEQAQMVSHRVRRTDMKHIGDSRRDPRTRENIEFRGAMEEVDRNDLTSRIVYNKST